MRKFTEWDNIGDDEIRIIGDRKSTKSRRSRWVIVPISVLIIGLIVLLSFILIKQYQPIEENAVPSLFEQISAPNISINEEYTHGFCELRDTMINDIPLRLFIPHNARATLHKGKLDKADTTIVYVSMAADVRADNGDILGAYVLQGRPLAWGLSKKGYCAIIDNVVTVGVADNSPLFERATETEGYFFRQYPLVDNGVLVENRTNAYNYLRALCQIGEETFMVHSNIKVSFHDFAQALVDLGCDNAIYLVGYEAYGWVVDNNGEIHEFGTDDYFDDIVLIPENLNYIVWRRE